MIIKATILQVMGHVKTFRGPSVKLLADTEDFGEIEVLAWRQEFPVTIIHDFLIGSELHVYVQRIGENWVGELLPFSNQTSELFGTLFCQFMSKADQEGAQRLKELPSISRRKSKNVPPIPHPHSEELERLLELPDDQDDH